MQALKLRENGIYVDATCGRGGHTRAILERLGSQGRVLAFDRDPDAVTAVRQRLATDPRLDLQHAPFSQLQSLLTARGLHGRVHGILFDLGVSSPQLDAPAARLQLPARWPTRHAHGPDQRRERGAVAAFRCRRRNCSRVARVRRRALRAPHRARNRACPRRISNRHHAPARRDYCARRADARTQQGPGDTQLSRPSVFSSTASSTN